MEWVTAGSERPFPTSDREAHSILPKTFQTLRLPYGNVLSPILRLILYTLTSYHILFFSDIFKSYPFPKEQSSSRIPTPTEPNFSAMSPGIAARVETPLSNSQAAHRQKLRPRPACPTSGCRPRLARPYWTQWATELGAKRR